MVGGAGCGVFGIAVSVVYGICIVFEFGLFDQSCVGNTCARGTGGLRFDTVFVAFWIFAVDV